ncbi:MAG TPA: terminase small subunit [Steroidobacter sp.]|uniref:terminase small subunit n=1 Tax=Steroidobacter sp. TaxID=1978227 RepID=UPI002ED78C9C
MTTETSDEATPALPKLTRRRQRFADEYLTGVSGAEAMRRIGSKGEPQQLAHRAYRMLQRAEVRAYLTERRKNLSEATQIRAEQIARELSLIAFGNLKSLFNEKGELVRIDQLPDDVAAFVSSIEVEANFEGRGEARTRVGDVLKIKAWNKVEALEKLAKLLGLLKEKVELDLLNAPPPVISITPYPDADDAEREARAAFSRNSPSA